MVKYPFDVDMLKGGPPLDEDALDTAIEAATEANVAGLDNQSQLEHAIRAYLAVVQLRDQDRNEKLRRAFPFLPKE